MATRGHALIHWVPPRIGNTTGVRRRRVAVFALLALAAFALLAILHLPTAPEVVANVGFEEGPPAGTLAPPLAGGTARQPEPLVSPTGRIRDDIPGWDSIRRTATRPEGSPVEPRAQLPPDLIQHGPEYLLLSTLLGLLLPVLGWVGLPLALHSIGGWADVPGGVEVGRPGPRLIALRAMAEERTHDARC